VLLNDGNVLMLNDNSSPAQKPPMTYVVIWKPLPRGAVVR